MNKKLHTFAYSGWDASGCSVRAQLQAEHLSFAIEQLLAQGFVIKKIRRQFFCSPLRLSAQELLLLMQQLAVLVRACLPMTVCLRTLAQPFKPRLRAVILQMVTAIESGKNLSLALQIHPGIFPHYFIHLIQLGEETGQLDTVLQQLVRYQEKILIQKQQIKQAMLYPIFVLVVSLMITTGLLILIVPQFQLLFADMRAQLPLMTRTVFYLSDFLQQLSMIKALGVLFIGLGLGYVFKNNASISAWIHTLIHKLPGIGSLLHDVQQTRYLYSLGIALHAGLPLLPALSLAELTLTRSYFAQKIKWIPAHIQSGMSVHLAFTMTAQFSDTVIQLITIGEKTSQLSVMLLQSADILETRLTKQIQQMTHLLQPTLMSVLGIVLGCIIIGLYLPVFQLGALY